jgi:hypothetical protein
VSGATRRRPRLPNRRPRLAGSLPCLAAAGLAAGMLGCSNDDAVLGVSVAPEPGMKLSLSQDVQPIFDNRCAVSGCHAGPSPAEQMSLEHARLFDPAQGAVGVASLEVPARKRIDPGSAATSYLVDKIEGRPAQGTQSMPLIPPPLSSAEIQIIRDWIDQGALDN